MPRADWEPLPCVAAVGVTGRVMLKRAGIAIASLRFSPNAIIDEHAAPFDIDVICIAGEGFVSHGDQSSRFRAGERVVVEMETLMVERIGL